MKKPTRRKTKPATITAPAMPAEGVGGYRDVAEAMIASATPEELRRLTMLMASHADGLISKVFDRNAAARQLLAWGKNHDRARLSYFKFIEITNTIVARALGLSAEGNNIVQREELLRLAASGLARQVAAGCPEVTWPDEAVFPLNERKAN
jgi:hypothetical protein